MGKIKSPAANGETASAIWSLNAMISYAMEVRCIGLPVVPLFSLFIAVLLRSGTRARTLIDPPRQRAE